MGLDPQRKYTEREKLLILETARPLLGHFVSCYCEEIDHTVAAERAELVGFAVDYATDLLSSTGIVK